MTEREKVIASLKHFSPETDKGIDWEKVDLTFLLRLDEARELSGVPIVVTSNYRSPQESINAGGFSSDAHTTIPCSAFDISCKKQDGTFDSAKAFKLVPALLAAGFNRIGLSKKPSHIHVDSADGFPQDRLWLE